MARTAVVAGTATAVAGGVSRRQQARAQQAADAEAWQQQQAMAAQQAQAEEFAAQQAAASQPAVPVDLVTQLKELAALKEQGILTEEEFAAQKARVLAT
jgi:hypothetical protein